MDSMYGRFIIPRHYTPGPPTPDPASVMLRTGKTHIEDEVQTILYFISRLPDNAIIVDGGANMGFFTIPVAQAVKEKGSKVISFEPQRQIYYALCGSCALNELENVFVHNLGLGDSQTTAQLSEVDYSDRTDFGMVSISEDVEVKEHKYLSSRTVNVITLDSMDLPSLEFLKLDVKAMSVKHYEVACKVLLLIDQLFGLNTIWQVRTISRTNSRVYKTTDIS